MRCVIARFPFDLTKSGVLESMKGIKPEPVEGESVIIGRRQYPVKQVGQVVTRQDRRDFSAGEVVRAMTMLGFTCRGLPQAPAAPAPGLTPLQRASAMLGAPEPVPAPQPASAPAPVPVSV
ncbi:MULTISPECIES: SCO5918 family protein [unclassified Streptomyces]|uniref:SCO5918 family protein n=1 Tax=unclassified Streptomyces TaxID=2593676 RepID=UPI00324AF0E4